MNIPEKELKQKYNPEGSILRTQQLRMLEITPDNVISLKQKPTEVV